MIPDIQTSDCRYQALFGFIWDPLTHHISGSRKIHKHSPGYHVLMHRSSNSPTWSHLEWFFPSGGGNSRLKLWHKTPLFEVQNPYCYVLTSGWCSVKYPLVMSNTYWTWAFLVGFPIDNGDFPQLCTCLPEPVLFGYCFNPRWLWFQIHQSLLRTKIPKTIPWTFDWDI